MSLGTKLRMYRIFDVKTKTALIVPMDHPVEGYFEELEDPRDLIRGVSAAGANAFARAKFCDDYVMA